MIGNAFKSTQAGGLIEVGVEPYQDHFLRFYVQDDGEGSPQEYHHRIFDKFVQVTDGNGVPLRKGTGLGLAFCRLTVEAHGGQIWVESSPDSGSIFYFCLPMTGEQ
jgi:signal transduction histidine kinase